MASSALRRGVFWGALLTGAALIVGCGPLDDHAAAWEAGKGDNAQGPHNYFNEMSDAELHRALADGLVQQAELLSRRIAELKRWSTADTVLFREWFGTDSEEARLIVLERLQQIVAFNQIYQADVGRLLDFFRKGLACHDNYYAYVDPRDPPMIYLCPTFVSIERDWQPSEGARLQMPRDLMGQGEYSASHVLTHEMSHFTGTGDYGYGVKQCTTLATMKRRRSAANADTIAFYVDGSLPPLVPANTFDDYAAMVVGWPRW